MQGGHRCLVGRPSVAVKMRVSEKWLSDYQGRLKSAPKKQNKEPLKKQVDHYDVQLVATDFLELAAIKGHQSDILTGLRLGLSALQRPSARQEHERMEQQCFLLYLQLFFPSLWEVTCAIPLGSLRPNGVGGSLKGEGVRKGWPDIVIDEPMHGFNGLRIEMKRASNQAKPSDEQISVCQHLAKRGYAVAVCWGHSSAIRYLHSYLKESTIFINPRYDYIQVMDFSKVFYQKEASQ